MAVFVLQTRKWIIEVTWLGRANTLPGRDQWTRPPLASPRFRYAVLAMPNETECQSVILSGDPLLVSTLTRSFGNRDTAWVDQRAREYNPEALYGGNSTGCITTTGPTILHASVGFRTCIDGSGEATSWGLLQLVRAHMRATRGCGIGNASSHSACIEMLDWEVERHAYV